LLFGKASAKVQKKMNIERPLPNISLGVKLI